MATHEPFHLTPSTFGSGSLRADSYARPGKLFTASADLMVAQVAALTHEAIHQLIEAVVSRAGGAHNNTMNPSATSLRSAAAGYRERWAHIAITSYAEKAAG
jgi:hypothetical protein